MDRRLLWFVGVVLVIRILVGVATPITDPTEGRYAQVAREMADSNDWVTPRVWRGDEHVAYLGKPPLYFWCAATSISLLGTTELAARLPAVVATVALLLFLYAVLRQTHGRAAALGGVMIAATTGLVFLMSASVVLDMQLTLFVSGAVLAHLLFVRAKTRRSRSRLSLLVFGLLAGGFLTKGPVAVVLFAIPVAIWTAVFGRWAELRAHRWVPGLALFSVVTIPWFVLAEIHNPGFLRYFFINENLLRFLSAEYGDLYGVGHVVPRGSAVVMFLLGAAPWTPVAIWLTVNRRWKVLRSTFRDESSALFFIGFFSMVVFWSLARQLLPTYLLPAVPLFAAWLAVELNRHEVRRRTIRRTAMAAAAVWVLVLCVAAPMAWSKSTRGILDDAEEALEGRTDAAGVLFATRAPHSASFYAPDALVRHPIAELGDSVREFRRTADGNLLVLRQRQLDDLPFDQARGLRVLAKEGDWVLADTAGAGRIASRNPDADAGVTTPDEL